MLVAGQSGGQDIRCPVDVRKKTSQPTEHPQDFLDRASDALCRRGVSLPLGSRSRGPDIWTYHLKHDNVSLADWHCPCCAAAGVPRSTAKEMIDELSGCLKLSSLAVEHCCHGSTSVLWLSVQSLAIAALTWQALILRSAQVPGQIADTRPTRKFANYSEIANAITEKMASALIRYFQCVGTSVHCYIQYWAFCRLLFSLQIAFLGPLTWVRLDRLP